jgi:DNA-binding IclR family transcriptional regulator
VAEVKAGIGSVASPIFSEGHVIGALSVCVPAGRFDVGRVRELAEVVRPAACRVSAAMAHRP